MQRKGNRGDWIEAPEKSKKERGSMEEEKKRGHKSNRTDCKDPQSD